MVTGFDIDKKKVNLLQDGRSYIYRIPETEIQLAKEHGFAATADYSLVNQMDVIIICVPICLTSPRP
jgi:UDP-N-acetyl-D-glucosamine dehydrogenase